MPHGLQSRSSSVSITKESSDKGVYPRAGTVEQKIALTGAFTAEAWKPRYMNAKQRHYLDIPKDGAWTLLFCSRPYHKWGFYVNNHKWRPLRYFHKYGIIQDENYQ